jgi:hypothetical protein
MKLLDVFRMINESQFLIERDVINAKELKQWAKESAARITNPQAATWYASQLAKYLINRYNEFRTAGLTDFDGDPPEWVVAKVQAGQGNEIIYVEPRQELRQQAEGVIDWLNAQTANNEAPNLRMTWEEAVEAQDEWHRDIARQSRVTELTKDQLEGIVTIMEFEDGFRWVDVQTEVCLQHEGTVMGHCVGQGGYTQGVQAGTTKILSLRDANNNPHATVEGNSDKPIIVPRNADPRQMALFDDSVEKSFVDMSIAQIKGKENKPVVRKYRDYVQEFLTKFGITNFGYGGLNDLENCGLFKLKNGGYANVEEVGEHVAKMADGSVWHRVDNEYVHLRDDHTELAAKWYLYDKTGRALGEMTEKKIDGRGVISRLANFGPEPMKYKDHVNTAFNTKYDKGRSQAMPSPILYSQTFDALGRFGLGGNGSGQVGEPQTIGKLKTKTDAGDVYATALTSNNVGDQYWLMHGDIIKSRFTLANSAEGYEWVVHFNKDHGIPSGSMPNFLKKIGEEISAKPIKISGVMIRDNFLSTNDIEWEPAENDEFIMEQDGVKFYQNAKGWYNAVDSHNHHIFNMNVESSNFKVRMVSDPKVAGFYAIYLIDELGLDIGEFTDYSSFARELLDETEWFNGRMSDTWYVIDETFPIHFTETHSYSDGSEEDVTDEDTTMKAYWGETGLYDSGYDEDYFAGEYEVVYRGGNIGYDDERYPDDLDDGGLQHTRTDYYVEGIGDADTVTHPVSGGTVRVSK